MGGFEDGLIIERDISPTGFSHLSDERGLARPSRPHDQDHRGIQKGFFRPSLHKPLEHAFSEARPIGIIGIG